MVSPLSLFCPSSNLGDSWLFVVDFVCFLRYPATFSENTIISSQMFASRSFWEPHSTRESLGVPGLPRCHCLDTGKTSSSFRDKYLAICFFYPGCEGSRRGDPLAPTEASQPIMLEIPAGKSIACSPFLLHQSMLQHPLLASVFFLEKNWGVWLSPLTSFHLPLSCRDSEPFWFPRALTPLFFRAL